MSDVTGANCECVHNAGPQANFEPPEESSNGLLGTASHRCLLPVCPGAKARKAV
jgi:hypothetical protein